MVLPPSPRTSGINPPIRPQIRAAKKILVISFLEILFMFFCKLSRLLINITAIIAQTGPRNRDKVTEGNIEISELVF